MLGVTTALCRKAITADPKSPGGTTALNMVLGLPGFFNSFSPETTTKLRIVAITSSAVSLCFGMIGIFLLLTMDKRKKVFRHDLILYLIICDCIKTLVLMLYPIVVLHHREAIGMPAFYNAFGWLTAYAIEGADVAIMFFAIHFAILIFKPQWRWKNRNTYNMEGGLYKYRFIIWPISIIIPILLASLAFINYNITPTDLGRKYDNIKVYDNIFGFTFQARIGGYKPFVTWCYLPPTPIWYKLALSWGPRYFLIISILTIYISIYIFVRRESLKIKAHLRQFIDDGEGEVMQKNSISYKLEQKVKHLLDGTRKFIFLQIEDETEDVEIYNENSGSGNQETMIRAGSFQIMPYVPGSISTENTKREIQLESKSASSSSLEVPAMQKTIVEQEDVTQTKKSFQNLIYSDMYKRRSQIQANLRSIFVYPFSYIAIWIFPIVADISQYHYEAKHGPIVWLAFFSAIFNPLGCLIHTMVLIYRETPWRSSWSVTQSKELIDEFKLRGYMLDRDICHLCNSRLGKKGWYYSGRERKKNCWSNQKHLWKRIAWMAYRFFTGVIHGHISFDDRCNDKDYWEAYYKGRSGESSNGNIEQVSYLEHSAFEEMDLPPVSNIWKIIHTLPMLHAINLDEVNRCLILEAQKYDSFLPGLRYSMNEREKTEVVQTTQSAPTTKANSPTN